MGIMTGGRVRWAVALLIAAATAVVAVLGSTVDRSPLARVPEAIAVERDVPYGSDAHQVLDLAYERSRSRPRPAIVMIHPGGWMGGDKSAYHGWMATYAGRGYVTVSLNFRPSTAGKFPAAIRDCKQAVRWLRSRSSDYGVDPRRIGVTGWSSGAHLGMLLALSDDGFEAGDGAPGVSSRVQAAVGVSGVYDFMMEERGRFPNAEDDPAAVRFLGGAPRRLPDVARRASPLHHLTADDPPFLLFHGELDRRIDVEQTRRLASASRALGRTDEAVLLPGADHGRDVFPDDSRSRALIRDFFDRHLRPGE